MQTPDRNYLAFSVTQLKYAESQIDRCAAQLTERQMWHRGGDHENSIANLLLHLEGNMRQWVLHGVARQPDVRQRDDEFSLTPTMTSAEAHALFTATLAEVCQTIATLDPARLLEMTNPQPTGTWPECTILEAIYRVVCHVHHHAGQIVLLTKQHVQRDLDLSMPRKRNPA
jgi:uncharacterized damage-inducible protein DinB